MKKLLASLLTSLILLLSLTGCSSNRLDFLYKIVVGTGDSELSTMAESVDSDFVSYEEILINNKIVDTPLLFFTEETASYAREVLTEKEKEEQKKAKKTKDSDKRKKQRYIVEKRTFGYDDDTVKDMEITFYLPSTKYDEKDMEKYGKEYEDYPFTAVERKSGDAYHTITITFVDLEYKENVAKLTKDTDLVIAKKKRISMKKTNPHLIEQGFSREF